MHAVRWASPERREVVVALQVLAADVNLGYHDVRNWIVDTVNGEPIQDFYDFTGKLRNNDQPFVVFRGESGFQLVLITRKPSPASRPFCRNTYSCQFFRWSV